LAYVLKRVDELGNTRMGWLATVVFLDLNGHPVKLDHDTAFGLVRPVAEGRLDIKAIA
jgi:death-on-curing protein